MLDDVTLGLIEDCFGDQIYITHQTAAALLQVDRKELTRMGDEQLIGYQLKGYRQRRYTRGHITNFIGDDACQSGKIEKTDHTFSNSGTEAKYSTAHARLRARLKRAVSKPARKNSPARASCNRSESGPTTPQQTK